MRSGLSYLLAARQCEIDELERLARTSELVATVGRFTHALQRERGVSNVFLASGGQSFAQQREQQVAQTESLKDEVLAAFDALGTHAPVSNGARLFNRVAGVVHGLEGLPELRACVRSHALTPRAATASYTRLIAGLLGVVFEAADAAGDPRISRALVAMFNYMQGKEFAGQERAHGAAVFACGRIDDAGRREWQHLIEQQQHCLQVFADFSDAETIALEQASQDHRTTAQLERLRRAGWSLAEPAPEPGSAQPWYDCCTNRIDAMRTVEDLLARHLRQLCDQQVAAARASLRDERASLDALQREARTAGEGGPRRFGPQLERSVYELLQEQSRRLQAMGDELASVRATLNERKLVERAKGLLMAHRHMSEDEAYKSLRQLAMNQKRRLADVAEAVLAMADMLPGASR